MAKAYDPTEVETRRYEEWVRAGYFKPDPDPSKPPFCIIMPPPNVTGELHLGHALTAAIEDLLTRWRRMLGDATLWLPGRDHAGIAGQLVVERQLAAKGKTRQEIGREAFLEEMWEWMEHYGAAIGLQHRRLGVSVDWDRERFTMDPGPSRAVRTAFVRLFERGLIYRGARITNWCPRCATALSDLEVVHEEEKGTLTYVRYPLVDAAGEPSTDEYIQIATTRPETILADTGIAVHPADRRYSRIVGRQALVPSVNRPVPIVADEVVEREFGTGAVKVTPGHDPIDFEIGQRHSLPSIRVIGLDGRMTEEAGRYAGMPVAEARKVFVEELGALGLLLKQEPHPHKVGHCDRCKTVVEPLVTEQWYVQIAPLAEAALAAVRDGRIRIVPDRFSKVYFNWLDNIRDWCISRQLWWGHRIPVWTCGNGHVFAAVQDPARCPRCSSAELTQDPDVLDTWFSSGLWPFSTLGWPDDTEDLRRFYPTSVMETGYDILFFWVARMIMLGLAMLEEVPFRVVYLHGLIRVGREKMSKVKGNVLNPLELIDSYGSDALRLSLVSGTTPGNDTQVNNEKLEANRNFVNKLWNAGRFVMGNVERWPARDLTAPLRPAPGATSEADRWIVSRANEVTEHVTRLLEDFQLGEAARMARDFLWGEFCDWYVEIAKIEMRLAETEQAREGVRTNLAWVFEHTLRLLHPMAPFVTEELWQNLVGPQPGGGGPPVPPSIVVAPWPSSGGPRDPEAERRLDAVMDLVRGVRNLRAEYRVDPGRWIPATILADGQAELYSRVAELIGSLPECRLRPITVIERSGQAGADVVTVVAGGVTLAIPLAGMVDVAQECARLERDRADTLVEVQRAESLLGKPGFVEKARPDVVQRERDKLAGLQERLAKIEDQQRALSG